MTGSRDNGIELSEDKKTLPNALSEAAMMSSRGLWATGAPVCNISLTEMPYHNYKPSVVINLINQSGARGVHGINIKVYLWPPFSRAG